MIHRLALQFTITSSVDIMHEVEEEPIQLATS